jgi:predicted dehydrogenase
MSITAGVVGCGNISKFHFDGLEKAGVKIKWVCDLAKEAAQPWAQKFGAAYTADYKDIIHDPAVNLVDVTAISAIHKPVCLDAIHAGKAVICEKTLAENAQDAVEIVREAEKKQAIFYTSYMKRFIPAVEKAKELLPSLGRILSTHIRAYQCWGNLWGEMPAKGFFHTPPGGISVIRKKFGGGILVCGGSHILDLVLFFLGRPQRLFASMHVPPGRDYDLQAAVLMETPNGTVLFEALSHPLNKIGFLRDGWDEKIEINGVNGRLEVFSSAWDNMDSKSSLLVHYDNQSGQSVEYRYNPVSPFARAIAFFCGNIEKGTQGSQSRRTGYDVDELISHILLSSGKHQAVEIDWKI